MVDANQHFLIADIGGTHSRFAIIDTEKNLVCRKCEDNQHYPDLGQALETYLEDLPKQLKPTAAVFAVASPLQGDEIAFTNLDWNFSVKEYASRFSFRPLEVVNDFAAIAMAIPGLHADDCIKLGAGEPVQGKPIAVIGPGTGLGVSMLVPVGKTWVPISGEGGHVTMAGFNEEEDKIIEVVRQELGHVSAERLLSGPGLSLLYRAIAGQHNLDIKDLDPATITAMDNTGEDPIASKTLDIFMQMLGTVAANIAVTVGAQGGVYIAGGILPKMRDRLLNSGFRQRFIDKGRYRDYLDRIPTYLITRENIALDGLRNYLTGTKHYQTATLRP